VLAKLPKSQHAKAKRALHEIWLAETKSAVKGLGFGGVERALYLFVHSSVAARTVPELFKLNPNVSPAAYTKSW